MDIETLLRSIDVAATRSDWVAVRRTAEQVLSHDPANAVARGYLLVCGRQSSSSSTHREGAGPRPHQPPARFMGRHAELGLARELLTSTGAGHGGITLVTGGPGAGKSCFAQAVADIARSSGFLVCGARSDQPGSAQPYLLWRHVMTQLSGSIGAQGPDPQIWKYLETVGVVDPADGGTRDHSVASDASRYAARPAAEHAFRLQYRDAIVQSLLVGARCLPVLVVLDDIRYADEPSLAVLIDAARAVRASRIQILCVCGETHLDREEPVLQYLAILNKEPAACRIDLKDFSRAESSQLIEAVTGARPAEQVIDELYASTGGNPLFLAEMACYYARVVDERTARGSNSGSAMPELEERRLAPGLPRRLEEIIAARVHRLPDLCSPVLAAASVAGLRFTLSLIREVLPEVDMDRLLEALDHAVAERFLREPGPGQYEFAHAVLRDYLSSSLSLTSKAILHRRVGAALERVHAGDIGEVAGEVADHYLNAGDFADSLKVAELATVAGGRALELWADEQARRRFRQALDALNHAAMSDSKARAMVGLGRALWMKDGTTTEVFDLWDRAFSHYVTTGATEQAVGVATLPSIYSVGTTGIRKRLSGLLARALELVEAESICAGRLLCDYAFIEYFHRPDFAKARAALDTALSLAVRHGDRELQARSLYHLGHLLAQETRAAESDSALDQALGFGDVLGSWHRMFALWVKVNNAMCRGDTSEASTYLSSGLRLVHERLANRDRYGFTRRIFHVAAYLSGKLARAIRLSDDDMARVPRNHELHLVRGFLECCAGRRNQACEHIGIARAVVASLSVDHPYPRLHFGAVAALVAFLIGDSELATEAEAGLRSILSERITPRVMLEVRTGLALAAATNGNSDSATEQYAALSEYRNPLPPLHLIGLDRILAILARSLDRLEDAERHANDSIRFCRRTELRAELAWSLSLCADIIEDRVQGGSRPSGSPDALRDESRSLAKAAGLALLESRLARHHGLDRAPKGTVAAPPPVDGLTSREVEVLKALSGGLSNAEIGDRLFISRRTVAHHISHILEKTGTANRTEAVAYAYRYGLIVSG